MLKKIIKSSICLILLSSTNIMAKEPMQSTASVKNESIAEAYDMLETMNMDKTYGDMLDKMMQAQTSMLPLELKEDKNKMEKLNKIIHDFMFKYLSWDKIKNDMAELYANNYTAEELREIKAFYLTPVGQKTLKIMPKIAIESMKLTQSKLIPHMNEMTESIKKLMQKEEEK